MPLAARIVVAFESTPSVEAGALFRTVGEGKRRSHHVTYGLDLVMLAEIEQTVETRAHRNASGICMRGSEGVEGPARIGDHGLCIHRVSISISNDHRIPVLVKRIFQMAFSLAEMPVHSVAQARGEVQILEEGEARKADLEVVVHSGNQLIGQLGEETVLAEGLLTVAGLRIDHRHACLRIEHYGLEIGHLETQLVLESGAVTQGELLIELFLAHAVLLLERIETADGEGDVRQGEGVGTVPGVLVVKHVHGEIELAVPVAGI